MHDHINKARKYRKRPVVIEAMQYDGSNRSEILYWVGRRYEGDPFERGGFIAVEDQWTDPPAGVTALVWDKLHDTWVGVKDGQWIIKGVQGEFYPCDPDVFAETYAEEGTAWPGQETCTRLNPAASRILVLESILAERHRELLEVKGPCRAPKCILHYAHFGPCHVVAESEDGTR